MESQFMDHKQMKQNLLQDYLSKDLDTTLHLQHRQNWFLITQNPGYLTMIALMKYITIIQIRKDDRFSA